MNDNIILINILKSSNYFSKLNGKVHYSDFRQFEVQKIYSVIENMYDRYNKVPSIDELKTYISTNDKEKTDNNLKMVKYLEKNIEGKKSDIDFDILLDSTKTYFKNSRFEKLLERGILLLEGQSKETISQIQDDMEKVLGFGFDEKLGHDYIEDFKERFEEYGKKEDSDIDYGLEILNLAFGGKGSLNVILAPADSGKTMVLSNSATSALLQGKNVAVFTFEDGELEWSSRIDSNLMDKPKEELEEKNIALSTTFKSIITDNLGRLKLKEYPQGVCTIRDIRKNLKDWKLKDKFEPDVIFVDYLGIMGTVDRSIKGYEKGNTTSQDLRALAQELKIPINSAVQARRDVFGSDSLDMADVADSIAISQNVNAMVGVIADSDNPDQMLLAILKSKRVNKNKVKPSVVNCDTTRQRLWDTEETLDYRKMKKKTKEKVKHTLKNMEDMVEYADSHDEEDLLDGLLNGKY